MKKHISVMMLTARGTIFHTVLIFLLLTISEALLFSTGGGWSFDSILTSSKINLCFYAAVTLMFASFSFSCSSSGSQPSYTIRRLLIHERTYILFQGIYFSICFFILWILQLAVIFILYARYAGTADDVLTSQTLFLTFYQNDFIHSVLPLAHISRYIRNIMFVVSLGFSAAVFAAYRRRDKICVIAACVLGTALVAFPGGPCAAVNDIGIGLFTMFLAAVGFINVWRDHKI